MKIRDFYLVINDLGFSPRIKEIIFKNETINKKTFIIPILNSVIILYILLFLFSIVLHIIKLFFTLIYKSLLGIRNSLRMMNGRFLDRNFNWYMKTARFKFAHSLGNVNFIIENN